MRRTSKGGKGGGPRVVMGAAPLDELERERAARQPTKEEKIREQQQLVDIHRGQRTEQLARQARELAALLDQHAEECETLAQHQQRDVAMLYRRHGREFSGFQIRALGIKA